MKIRWEFPLVVEWDGPVFGLNLNGYGGIPGIIFIDGTLPPDEWIDVYYNELCHQRHYLELLVLYPVFYLTEYAIQRLRYGRREAYENNIFEVDSRTHERNFRDRRPYWWLWNYAINWSKRA